jgi:peroxidase
VPNLIESFKNRMQPGTRRTWWRSPARTPYRRPAGTSTADDTIDPAFRTKLAAKCANDPAGAGRAHPRRLRQQVLLLRPHRQAGAVHVGPSARPHVRFSLNQAAFFDQFSTRSMVKMSQLDVLTGNAGEIRLAIPEGGSKNTQAFPLKTQSM